MKKIFLDTRADTCRRNTGTGAGRNSLDSAKEKEATDKAWGRGDVTVLLSLMKDVQDRDVRDAVHGCFLMMCAVVIRSEQQKACASQSVVRSFLEMLKFVCPADAHGHERHRVPWRPCLMDADREAWGRTLSRGTQI